MICKPIFLIKFLNKSEFRFFFFFFLHTVKSFQVFLSDKNNTNNSQLCVYTN